MKSLLLSGVLLLFTCTVSIALFHEEPRYMEMVLFMGISDIPLSRKDR